MDTRVASAPPKTRLKKPWLWISVTGLAVVLAATGSYFYFTAAGGTPEYVTAAARLGDITQTVSANGTLNPVVEVNVGSQVSGTVEKLHADYNSRVRRGQLLLELDPTLFKAQLAQSEAALHNAQAALRLAQLNETRVQAMRQKGYVAKSDLDQAVATREAAAAQVELASAQVQRDRTNLAYTVIRSPVDGVVINREVDVGQTVAASFQTPTLFIIGQNLRNMQIDTTIDEADVGGIAIGQQVNFTVDAYPERKFAGKVVQVRLSPTIVQNVVTYDVVVGVDNADLALLPGMTAYVNVVVRQRHGVLLVPNASLRIRLAGGGTLPPGASLSSGVVYVLTKGVPRAVAVSIGASDGQQTEITAGDLRAGDQVVTAFAAAKQAKRNPFQLF